MSTDDDMDNYYRGRQRDSPPAERFIVGNNEEQYCN